MTQREHGLQIGVARLLDLVLDPARTWFTAIDHAAKLSARYGGERKRRGVKPGLPDFLILVQDEPPLGLELKAGKGRLSPQQTELRADWLRLGVRYVICRSLAEVQDMLAEHGVPVRRKMLILGRDA